MSEETILVVDDEKNIVATVAMTLKSDGYKVRSAHSGEEALEIAEKKPIDLAIVDIMMPGMDGLEFLKIVREKWPETIVIMMSGHGTISTAVQATKLGAYDFIEKPLSREKLLLTAKRALDFKRLENENIALRSEIAHHFDIIGDTPVMKDLFMRIETVGNSPSRVLIRGENGVGKELVARALHQASPRRDKPFIKVNCAAIPHELIESELFGHEKGAFTGATAMRRGKFELAHKGTIFLDEIGDMHLDTQAKVLRVLQENEFQRVGGDELIKVDVRVITATNKELEEEIRKNRFREDLFFRLNVIPIRVPSLRERKSDIPLLAAHFFRSFAHEYGRPAKNLDESALEALKNYHWSGNVRELKNFMERLFIMAPGDEIDEHTVKTFLPYSEEESAEFAGHAAPDGSLKEAVNGFEREFIMKKLSEHNYHIAETARDLQ
ncbi:MAG TPA: sigma-54 dependent transcriptional regulator, partial [bacterium]|nr:sigma-54 dependent transcriptional regulator [bacterium]